MLDSNPPDNRTDDDRKECISCNRTLSLNDFHIDRSRNDDRSLYCKVCVSKKGKLYRRIFNQHSFNGHYDKARDTSVNGRPIVYPKYRTMTAQQRWKKLTGKTFK